MSVAETVKDAVGLGQTRAGKLDLYDSSITAQLLVFILPANVLQGATREEMSAARLPLAYRDSCAHLLIPLNQCRHKEYYLPWKCVVCLLAAGTG